MSDDDLLVSFDVVALYTNVTYEQVVKSLEKRVHLIHRKCRIPFQEILNITKFLFDNMYFIFNGKYYRQIRGCPMGSPISCLFANIVLEDLELECLRSLENQNCKPKFYARYVDDTFICLKKTDLEKTYQMFNKFDKDLKFTYEIENDQKINFLDVTVCRSNNNILTDWYRKSICSDRVIMYTSNHSLQQKKNIVYNLVDRALSLSDPLFHKKNRQIITDILLKNHYPRNFIETHIEHRLKKLSFTHQNNNNANDTSKRPTAAYTLSIPLTPMYNRIANLFKPHNIRTVPTVNKSLTSIITRGKDKCNILDRNNVVYKFECKDCDAVYVGETKIKLQHHRCEHNKIK